MQIYSCKRPLVPIVALLCAAVTVPAHAQEPKPLKTVVRLVEGDTANEAWSSGAQPGRPVAFQLRVLEAEPENSRQAELTVTSFSAQPPAVASIPASIRVAGSAPGTQRAAIVLDAPKWVDAELLLDGLRPGTTYKGRVALSAGSLYHAWEITLITPGQGSLTTEAIPATKIVTVPPCRWAIVRYWLEDCDAADRNMPFTVTNRTDAPFTKVRTRFEPAGTATTKTTASNFTIDSFSFWNDGKPLDLENRSSSTNIRIPPQQQLKLNARVEPLTPGEYSGAFRFGSAEVSGEAQEPKLLLAIQVRHHWALPVVVILFGSFLGWFGSKYVVGARKARALRLQVQDLRARADDFVRSDAAARNPNFVSEGTSFGLARVRVILSQLAELSSSVLPMLLREEEITARRQDAERRIAALESVRTTRISVELSAVARPAAQLVIGRLLRAMHNVLEGATFADAQQTELTKQIQSAGAWAATDTFSRNYCEAILERMGGRDIPTLEQIRAMDPGPLRHQLEAIRGRLPSEQDLKAAAVPVLEGHDQAVGKLNLLWRERDTPWIEELIAASAGPASLDELFHLVDLKAWTYLEDEAKHGRLTLDRELGGNEKPEVYDLIVVCLKSGAEHVNDRRILFHPLNVVWRIALPNGNARNAITPGVRLTQYFTGPGSASVTARLRWEGKEIPIPGSFNLEVLPDSKYRLRSVFSDWTEYAVILLGAGFAAATGISSLYDATFGSFGQYLGLLAWSAGAGTGGNLFKELGTTGTVGGRTDVTLPARS